MTHAMRINAYGGPEVMTWETHEPGDPAPGEIRVRHHAVGLNFIDCYQREGLYPFPSLPATLGNEGAGEVTAIGDGVTLHKVGDRVAYASPVGAYCEERLMPADRALKLPDSVEYETAAAMMLGGMTVRYLLRQTYEVKPGTVLLFHAAAGGVGQIACQWAKHLGATIIGTAGTDEKCAKAIAAGADHCINYTQHDFSEQVRTLTDGRGVDVVYDSVGAQTINASLDCLRPRGLMVSFGNATGPVTGFNLADLAKRGSLYVTRPVLNAYTSTREELEENAADLFDLVTKGIIKIEIGQRYALKDAAQAHRDLQARKTTGSTVLLP